MAVIKPFRIKSLKKLIKLSNLKMYLYLLETEGFDEINFKINKNTIHGLLGPNGAGKSALFLMTGLLEPSKGKIKLDGEDYSFHVKEQKNMGYMYLSMEEHFQILRF